MLKKLLNRRRPPTQAPAVPSADILRRVRTLEVRTRGFVESLYGGEYLSVFHGRGMEFSHVRGYQVGDDVRAIDWKVTARRGSPFVRQFVEERDLLVALVVDVSASGRFGAGNRSVGEVATEIAAALTFAATRNNDRIALLLVSDRVEHFVPPGSGRRHAVRVLADLLSRQPRRAPTDLTPALERVARTLTGRATVFLISDFIHERGTPYFRAALSRVARGHDLVAIRLASIASDELPDVGWVEMTDPESGRRALIDTGSRRLRRRYRESIRLAHVEMAALLLGAGAELIDVDTAADPLGVLTDFFRRRQRIAR